MRNLTAILLALALGLGALPAAASFDNLAVSPRARAMGGGAVAVADDAYAPYFNPAGLAGLASPQAAASYMRPAGVSFVDYIYAGAAYPLGGGRGTLGVGVRRLATEWQDVSLERETTATLAYGLKLYEDMHSSMRLGLSANAYNLRFGDTVGSDGEGTGAYDPGSDTVLGVDAGLLVTVRDRTRLGVLVHNVNNPQIGLDQEEVGQRVHGGIAYAAYEGVWTTFEFENVMGQDVIYHGGAEVSLDYGLALRVGVATNPEKVTAGFGYHWHGVSVDYGFSGGGGTLDGTHQFGVGWVWGGEAR